VRGREDVYLMMEERRLESDKLLHVGIHNKGKARRFQVLVWELEGTTQYDAYTLGASFGVVGLASLLCCLEDFVRKRHARNDRKPYSS